jgi:hypothetical protein
MAFEIADMTDSGGLLSADIIAVAREVSGLQEPRKVSGQQLKQFMGAFAYYNNDKGGGDCASDIQGIIDLYGFVALERGKTYRIDTALNLSSGAIKKAAVMAYGTGPKPIIKHVGTASAIVCDRTAQASASIPVTGLANKTVNSNFITEMTVASLNPAMVADAHFIVGSNDSYLGEDTTAIVSIVYTTSTSATVTTARPHGLTTSRDAKFAYTEGSTQINGQELDITSVPTSTTFVCTTPNNSTWGAHTANSGYVIASNSKSWLQYGGRVMGTAGTTKVQSYDKIPQIERMTTTPYMRILENDFSLLIQDIEIQANGDPYNTAITGEANRCPAIVLKGVVNFEIDVIGRRNWSTLLRLESCMRGRIIYEYHDAPNFVNIAGYGYGLVVYASCYDIVFEYIRTTKGRHPCGTSGSQNSSTAWSGVTWNTKGSSRKIRFKFISANCTTGMALDMHETGEEWTVDTLIVDASIRGRAMGTNTATPQAITAVTNASTGVVTYVGSDNFNDGDIFQVVTPFAGGTWNTLNAGYYMAMNVNKSANTFELFREDGTPVNTTGLGTYTASTATIRNDGINPNGGQFIYSWCELYIWHGYCARLHPRCGDQHN